VKTLLHADIYRETGGEEAQEKQREAERMQQQARSGQLSGSRPTGSPSLTGHR